MTLRRLAMAAALAVALAAPPVWADSAKGVLVEAITLQPTPLAEYVSAVGDLASDESVIVRPEIAGRICEIGFHEGAPVEADSVLVRLDDAIYRAELAQAEARLTLSRQNLERAQTLNRRGHSSEQTLDIAREETRVNGASAELVRARLEKTVIRAPFAGVVGLKSVSIGDYVEAGDPIVNLEKISTLKVDFRIPERYLRVVQVGGPVEIELDAFPGETHAGEIYAVDPRVRETDRSVAIRARLPNPDGRLRPGLFARVRLVVSRQTTAIVAPEEAIVPRGDRRFVYRVVDGKAVLTEVRIGLRETGRVEIVDGLKAGDRIITAGQIKVRDGADVRVVERDAPAAPTAAADENAKG